MINGRRNFLKNITRSLLGLAALSGISATALGDHPPDDFTDFMSFSSILTDDNALNHEFGALCWRYVQFHSSTDQRKSIAHFLQESSEIQEKILSSNPEIKSLAYHTLLVWYKGDLSSINHTTEEAKIAYFQALKWKAIGIPARGVCVGNWSEACMTS